MLYLVVMSPSHLWSMTASQTCFGFDDLDRSEEYWVGILYHIPRLGLN